MGIFLNNPSLPSPVDDFLRGGDLYSLTACNSDGASGDGYLSTDEAILHWGSIANLQQQLTSRFNLYADFDRGTVVAIVRKKIQESETNATTSVSVAGVGAASLLRTLFTELESRDWREKALQNRVDQLARQLEPSEASPVEQSIASQTADRTFALLKNSDFDFLVTRGRIRLEGGLDALTPTMSKKKASLLLLAEMLRASLRQDTATASQTTEDQNFERRRLQLVLLTEAGKLAEESGAFKPPVPATPEGTYGNYFRRKVLPSLQEDFGDDVMERVGLESPGKFKTSGELLTELEETVAERLGISMQAIQNILYTYETKNFQGEGMGASHEIRCLIALALFPDAELGPQLYDAVIEAVKDLGKQYKERVGRLDREERMKQLLDIHHLARRFTINE